MHRIGLTHMARIGQNDDILRRAFTTYFTSFNDFNELKYAPSPFLGNFQVLIHL